jgi:hypothetical protein
MKNYGGHLCGKLSKSAKDPNRQGPHKSSAAGMTQYCGGENHECPVKIWSGGGKNLFYITKKGCHNVG